MSTSDSTTTSAPTPAHHTGTAFGELIEEVRAIVRRDLAPQPTAERVAQCLQPFLTREGLVSPEHLHGDPDHYVQHVLHTEDDGSFSIVALVWLPGQHTAVHDHVAWCVTGVCQGTEHEERYRVAGPETGRYLAPAGTAVNETGSVCGFAPPGDIHRVVNSGQRLAVSLHIYGADISRLNSSVRREYHLPVHDVSGDICHAGG